MIMFTMQRAFLRTLFFTSPMKEMGFKDNLILLAVANVLDSGLIFLVCFFHLDWGDMATWQTRLCT